MYLFNMLPFFDQGVFGVWKPNIREFNQQILFGKQENIYKIIFLVSTLANGNKKKKRGNK